MNGRILIATLAAAGIAGTAGAQTVNHRQANQSGRIAAGEASGRLTPGEAAHVEHQQGAIAGQESRMRARNGGHLTPANRAHLETREDKASAHIANAKHNGRGD